jgi:dephospho-CoA kinase
MAFRYAVALTGSIATGKSTAAKLLSDLGFEIIDADKISHLILNEQYEAIIELFGESLVHDGIVDRKALGAIVFNDEAQRKILEDLLHPLIYERIERLSADLDQKKRPYLVDIPLFYEGKRYPIEKTLVVYTPKLLQQQRLIQRDNSHHEEAKNRISLQICIEEKCKRADYVIDNSGTLSQLERECERIYEEITKDFK